MFKLTVYIPHEASGNGNCVFQLISFETQLESFHVKSFLLFVIRIWNFQCSNKKDSEIIHLEEGCCVAEDKMFCLFNEQRGIITIDSDLRVIEIDQNEFLGGSEYFSGCLSEGSKGEKGSLFKSHNGELVRTKESGEVSEYEV